MGLRAPPARCSPGWPIRCLRLALPGDIGFAAFLAVAFAWRARRDRTGKALGVADHGAIVWDEIAAFWCVLF